MNGGGLNFVHGGISLQEMVVPVIDYHFLRNDNKAYQRNREKYDTRPVTVSLLSASRKISNMIFSLNFYQKEAVRDNRVATTYSLYFTDANGKPVIPAGTLHDGFWYQGYVQFWTDYNISNWRQEDGKVVSYMLSKDEDPKMLFIRKLIKDGLFDLEAFSNTDTMAKEKLAVGKLATFGGQSSADDLYNTLYKTNPEMQYELLGPFLNKSGNICAQVEQKGRNGFPAMFISAQCKNPDAVFRFLDYVNSDEGHLLAYYGIEGTHYTMENGRPKIIPELKAKWDAEGNLKRDEGLVYLQNFIGAFSQNVTWPMPDEEKRPAQILMETYQKKIPIEVIDKVDAGYLGLDWPKLEDYKKAVAQLDYEGTLKKAFFAKTDEEALKMMSEIRAKLIAAGLQERGDWIAEKAAGRDDIGF